MTPSIPCRITPAALSWSIAASTTRGRQISDPDSASGGTKLRRASGAGCYASSCSSIHLNSSTRLAGAAPRFSWSEASARSALRSCRSSSFVSSSQSNHWLSELDRSSGPRAREYRTGRVRSAVASISTAPLEALGKMWESPVSVVIPIDTAGIDAWSGFLPDPRTGILRNQEPERRR